MAQDTNVENLIINKLTKAQYESITNPDPTQLYFITDEVISSADVINALGYTPYNATNPAGYITSADLPTNYVTTDTAQSISGRKTFLGEKAIYFKQNSTSDKLGFTLYNPSNTELGALEWRPNTIGSSALLALNCPQSGSNYVGFRYWSNINIVAPRPTTDGIYYIPVNVTDGTNTVTANNNGTLNISSLLPDVSDMATQTWVTNQGYTTNVGTVTSVNNIQPDASGNVTLTIPDTATWGNITGTLSNQTDLQTALNSKLSNSGNGGNRSLGIMGTITSSRTEGTWIGYNSEAANWSTACGFQAKATGQTSIAIGWNAKVTSTNSIQIGYGTNSTPNTLSIGFNNTSYTLLNGITGLIPDARISSDIARTSQIPTNNNQLTNGAGYITGITSSDVTTALGYTPYNATNPNGYITASALTGYATEQWVSNQNYVNSTTLATTLADYQPLLVSGTNIKTLNGNSILGSGDLTLDGLPSQTGQSGKFLTTDGTDASWATVTIPTPTYDSVNERITW